MDLFDFMGVIPEEKPEKSNKGKKEQKRTSSAKKKEYHLPLTVIVPYTAPQVIAVENGKDTITENELNDRYGSYLSWTVADDSKNIIVGSINMSQAKAKGETNLKEVRFGDTVIVLSNISQLSDVSEMLVTDNELLKGCTFSFLSRKDYLIPVITGCDICETEGNSSDPEEEAKRELYIPGIGVFINCTDDDDVNRIIDEHFLGLSKLFDVHDNGTNLIACLKPADNKSTANINNGQYDISSGSVALSLVWTKFILNPNDFAGKTTVDKNDLCTYLIARGYPEYTSDRTNFEYADKNGKNKELILALLKSSSKG